MFVHSRCLQNLIIGDFTSFLCTSSQIGVLKCVLHLHQDYFSSFRKNNRCTGGAVTREVVSSTPAGPTAGESAAFVITSICKWLDSLVFSDKDDKPEVPSHNPSMFIILWDVKEPTHLLQRVGHVVPGVVVCLL